MSLPSMAVPIARLLSICCAASFCGCASVRLPLCQDLARTTYNKPVEGNEVSRYTRDVAERWRLDLTLLSPFAMRVTGDVWNVNRFQAEYPFLVCGFDPVHVLIPHDTYLRCMQHAPDWIVIVQSDKPENLMVTQTLYEATCASGRPVAVSDALRPANRSVSFPKR
jgi:hypothetical protein